MKQAISIFCLYIGIVTLVTLSLFQQPIEINVVVSLFSMITVAGVLLLATQVNKTRHGSY